MAEVKPTLLKCKYHTDHPSQKICTLLTCFKSHFGCQDCTLENIEKRQHFNEHIEHIRDIKSYVFQVSEQFSQIDTNIKNLDTDATLSKLTELISEYKSQLTSSFDNLTNEIMQYKSKLLLELDSIANSKLLTEILPNISNKENFFNFIENQDQDYFGQIKKDIYTVLKKSLRDEQSIKIGLQEQFQTMISKLENVRKNLIGNNEKIFSSELIFTSPKSQIIAFEGNRSVKYFDVSDCQITKETQVNLPNSSSFGLSTELNLIAVGNNTQPFDIKIIGLQDQIIKFSLYGHSQRFHIHPFVFIEEEKQLVSGSFDKTLRVWNLENQKSQKIIQCGAIQPHCLIRVPQTFKIAFGGEGSYEIGIIDTVADFSRKNLAGHTSVIQSLEWNALKNLLISGSVDKSIKFWDIETGICLRNLSLEHPVYFLKLVNQRNVIFVGTGSGFLLSYNAESLENLVAKKIHNGAIYDVDFDEITDCYVTASEDKQIGIWALEDSSNTNNKIIKCNDAIFSVKFI